MRRKLLLCAGVLAAAGSIVAARAAGTDGTWQIAGQGQSPRCPDYSMQLEAKGGAVTGTVGTVRFTYKMFGKIGPDGSFAGQSPGGTAHMRGKFTGDTVTAEFVNDVCAEPRQGTGHRVQ